MKLSLNCLNYITSHVSFAEDKKKIRKKKTWTKRDSDLMCVVGGLASVCMFVCLFICWFSFIHKTFFHIQLSFVLRKPVFAVSDQV